MTQRELIVVELLRTLPEVQAPLQSGGEGGIEKTGRLLLMGNDYHQGSYRELERLLAVMKEDRPSQRWHVLERYTRCDRRRMKVRFVGGKAILPAHHALIGDTLRGKGTRAVTVEERIVEAWDPSVRLERVRRGVAWLAVSFRGSPQLPKDLMDRVAA